ncbi:hypothetical protein HDU98_010562 [Podochytrium sp. JEL0797]|nr:hypothetical protein HDU98_010562 [Podochytrium sp. JEL0797]
MMPASFIPGRSHRNSQPTFQSPSSIPTASNSSKDSAPFEDRFSDAAAFLQGRLDDMNSPKQNSIASSEKSTQRVRALSLAESMQLMIDDEEVQEGIPIRPRPSGARVAEVVQKLEEQERAERKRREADEEILRKRAALMNGEDDDAAMSTVSVATILEKIRTRQEAVKKREEEEQEAERRRKKASHVTAAAEVIQIAKQDSRKPVVEADPRHSAFFDSKPQDQFTLSDLRQLQYLEKKLKQQRI